MPAVLSARGISKRFGATLALDDVSFDLAAGEVHALVGENGAVKLGLHFARLLAHGASATLAVLEDAKRTGTWVDSKRELPEHALT